MAIPASTTGYPADSMGDAVPGVDAGDAADACAG